MWIVRKFEVLNAMRLQFAALPGAVHRHVRDAKMLGQRTRTPMRRTQRLALPRSVDQSLLQLGGQFATFARPPLVMAQGFDAAARESGPHRQHCGPRDAYLARD